jgi:hypothetical protein
VLDHERASRAREARTLVDNPVFVEAVTKVRADLLARFEASAAGDVNTWKNIHAELHGLKAVQGALSSFRADGDKAVSLTLRRNIG